MNNSINDSIKLLRIKDYTFIGSYCDKNIKYPLDIDLQEISIENYSSDYLLSVFQKKYISAINNDKMFVIDFKCGKYKGQPIRWTKDTIKAGFQYIDDVKINFVDSIRQKEIIKLDLISIIDKKFVELSINYYFQPIPNKGDLENIFLREFQTKMSRGEFFKALKRLYSYSKLTKNKQLRTNLINFLNSPIGALNYQINGLNMLLSVISNNFRTPTKGSILFNLNVIKNNLSSEYNCSIKNIMDLNDIQEMILPIEQLVNRLNKRVNDRVQLFIKDQINFKEIFLI